MPGENQAYQIEAAETPPPQQETFTLILNPFETTAAQIALALNSIGFVINQDIYNTFHPEVQKLYRHNETTIEQG